jgi:O-methyltransferase
MKILQEQLRGRGIIRWLAHRRHNLVRRLLGPFGLELQRRGVSRFPEVAPHEVELIRKYAPYTMTSEVAQWGLLRAIAYLDSRRIPGDIVECGVWRGGNLMMVKDYRGTSTLERRLFLFDTFAGMTEPTVHDVGYFGEAAHHLHRRGQRHDHNAWAYASLEEVTNNFRETGLLDQTVIFREGPVEETLTGGKMPDRIALLRLDTDWYESTRIELEVLYPRLASGGVLIIDDYGSWKGSRKATDEYFADQPQLLIPLDIGCRIAIKV